MASAVVNSVSPSSGTQAFPAPGVVPGSIRLSCTEDGAAISWVQELSPGRSQVFASLQPGAPAAQAVSGEPVNLSQPSLSFNAVAGSGGVGAVSWTTTTPDGKSVVSAAIWQGTGGWSASTVQSEAGGNANSSAIGVQGSSTPAVSLLWAADGTINARTRTAGGSWTPATAISTAVGSGSLAAYFTPFAAQAAWDQPEAGQHAVVTVGDNFTSTTSVMTLTSGQSGVITPVVGAIHLIGWQIADGDEVEFWASHSST